MKILAKLLLLLFIIFTKPTLAQVDLPPNQSLMQEQLAQKIFSEVRCMVCNGQTIGESDVEMAKSMRLMIRELIVKGNTQAQIEQFLINRYGDQILTKPPLNFATSFLWLAPFVILILASLNLIISTSKKR
jgi:cytochrome c-type biogenesis protein CcmH